MEFTLNDTDAEDALLEKGDKIKEGAFTGNTGIETFNVFTANIFSRTSNNAMSKPWETLFVKSGKRRSYLTISELEIVKPLHDFNPEKGILVDFRMQSHPADGDDSNTVKQRVPFKKTLLRCTLVMVEKGTSGTENTTDLHED